MLKKVKGLCFLVIVLISFSLTGCFGTLSIEPDFNIDGVNNGEIYDKPVTIVINASKGTTLVAITLNDNEFESGTTITDDGGYKLVVVGRNDKGEEKIEELEFSLEIQVPLIRVVGVENGVYYSKPVIPTISTDSETDIIVAKLNDKDYQSGTEISEHGNYTLLITATNESGRAYSLELTFEIGIALQHSISISDELRGFTVQNGALEYDTNNTKEGEGLGSIKVSLNNWVILQVEPQNSKDPHPDWVSDWSQYDKLSAWVFFDELDTMPDTKGVSFRIPNRGDLPRKNYQINKADLKEGWNYIEVNLETLMEERSNELTNMDDNPLQIVIDKQGSFNVTGIKFTRESK